MKSLPFPTVVRVTAVGLALTALIALAGAAGNSPRADAAAAPPNDNFADARVIAEVELPFGDSVDVAGATIEIGEPFDCFFLDHTVWYKFTPSTAAQLRADTQGSNISAPFINVYTGASSASLAELSPLSCGSTVDFSVSAGTTYYFQVGDFYGQQSGTLAFNLIETGSISGTVTEEGTGTPLADICVNVVNYISEFDIFGSGFTDAAGNYTVGVLPTGSYGVAPAVLPAVAVKVQFFDCGSGTHIGEWYNDKPDFASADLVAATAGSTTPGINAALAVGGSISGTVTEEGTGTPLPDVCATIYDTSNSWAGSGYTDGSGNYTIGGLVGGSYKVQFQDCFLDPTHISEWYNDKTSFESADLVSVTEGSDTSGINAALAVGGSIFGVVTEEGSGISLESACVSVYDSSYNWMGSASTDSSGSYTVGGLPTGSYKVQFSDCSFPGPATYISEWYNDKPDFNSANLVSVTQGSTTSGVNAALAVGGSISGVVTEEGTGTPLPDINVAIYDSCSNQVGWAYTDPSGSYTVGGLPSGGYKVRFDDWNGPYISEWYNDTPDCEAADLVAVTQGSDTPGIDASLAVEGSISGTVTEEGTGAPLADVCVTAYDTSWNWLGSSSTDASGNYSVGGLATGNYKVQVDGCGQPSTHIAEWYNDKPAFNSADLVSVTQGSTTSGIDAALAVGGTISGTVTEDGTGTPLPDICVTAYELSGWGFSSVGYGTTDASGTYSVGGLSTGDYMVQFRDCNSDVTYIAEWYDDQPTSFSADPVAVTQGFDASGIDAALAVGGSISGTVTEEGTATPLPGICVNVQSASPSFPFSFFGFDFTDSSGNYQVGGLPTGGYRVQFYDCQSSPAIYIPEWYNDKPNFSSADVVAVTQGVETSGKDAALAVAGIVSGTVTEEGTGTPLADICVDVNNTTFSFSGFVRTDPSGSYAVGGLPSGDYRVHFYDCSDSVTHVDEWYNDRPDFDSADLVSVTQGSTTSGIDAALAVGGSISGTVTDEGTGTPLVGICISVNDASFLSLRSAITDSSGNYTVGGLRTGDYKVQFTDCQIERTHLSEWYDNKAGFQSADLVSVTLGVDTPGVDAALALGGTIAGTVTEDGTGTPLSDICVTVLNDSLGWTASDTTDSSGSYSVGALPSGQYAVQFSDCPVPAPLPPTGGPVGLPATGGGVLCTATAYVEAGATHVPEWYNDRENCLVSDLVSVTQGLDTVGIDTALAIGGEISGTVTDESANPLRRSCIWVQDASGSFFGWASTDASGNYAVGGLPTGNYDVQFSDCNTGEYLAEWYNDKPDLESADPVAVTQGLDTLGIDAALALGGTISGTVTEEGTGTPLSEVCVTVYDPSWSWVGSGSTDFSGSYSVHGLPSGDYKVEFRECGFLTPIHVSEWYNDQPDFFSAGPVSVTQALETSGINAALAVGGSISGTVTEEGTGTPLPSICVGVYDAAFSSVGGGSTDASGNYTVEGLATGSYRVRFDDCGFPATHVGEWYSDKADFEGADPVAVTQGLDTAGIDADLSVGGTITGVVLDETAQPIWGASVCPVDGGGLIGPCGYTEPDGTYTIGGLPTGDYTLFADAPGFAGECYDNVSDCSLATPVNVSPGLTTSGINFALGTGGTISGTVTDESGTPIWGAQVGAASLTGCCELEFASTDRNGMYEFEGMATGSFLVIAEAFGFKGEYYDDAGDPAAAASVAVTAPAETLGIDFALAVDGDDDGVSDAVEVATGTSPTDADSDDDGLCDGVPVTLVKTISGKGMLPECTTAAGFGPFPFSATLRVWGEDANGNGVVDAGETDPRDADSDNDGLSDGLERGLAFKGYWNTDASNPNFQLDSDPLSTTDPLNSDTDGDGLLDGDEDANHNGRVDSGETDPNVSDLPPESVSVPAPAGGTVTTDTEADGATVSDPVETSVTTPNAGTVTIEETPITLPSPVGFQFLGQQVNITAPAATSGDPLVIVFRIDASRIPPGEGETTIQLFKDGVLVPACTGAPWVASPDPCVSARALLGDGDVEITVLTSTVSAWNLGACVVTDCDADGFTNAVEGSLGTDPFLACGGQGWPPDFNGDTRVNLSDIFLFRSHFATVDGDPNYGARFDLTADGRVNLADVFILRQYFATQCGP